VKDRRTGIPFLIDTGAEISVIPVSKGNHQPTAQSLRAANGSPIATYGQRLLNLDLKLRREFPWVFTIAAVPFAIIGIDFLQHFDLLVDTKRTTLIDGCTKLCTHGVPSNNPLISPMYYVPDTSDTCADIIHQFPKLLRPSTDLPTGF
jgi:hypothetical protein